MNDTQAIDEIVRVLDSNGQPWTSETIEHVAEVVATVRDASLWAL